AAPSATGISLTVPAVGAAISFSIFIASSTTSTSPALTAWPTVTATLATVPGSGAVTDPGAPPPAGAAGAAGAGAGAAGAGADPDVAARGAAAAAPPRSMCGGGAGRVWAPGTRAPPHPSISSTSASYAWPFTPTRKRLLNQTRPPQA